MAQWNVRVQIYDTAASKLAEKSTVVAVEDPDAACVLAYTNLEPALRSELAKREAAEVHAYQFLVTPARGGRKQ